MKIKTVVAAGLISMLAMSAQAKITAKMPVPKAPAAVAMAPEAQAAILRDDALKSNIAYDYLSELTTRFGPRPAGSETEKRAAQWAADHLKALGFENVHVETFPLYVWSRGAESIDVTAPFPQPLVGLSLGATTAGTVEAEAVIFDTYQLFLDSKTDLTGKIVVILQPMAQASDGSGYGRMSGTVRRQGPIEAQKRGAVGYVMRSLSTDTHRFAHAGASTWNDKGIPSMAISVPDAEQLGRIEAMQKAGTAGALRLKLMASGQFLGLGTSQNVVADIVGSEHPEQVIVLGGHMDSWDKGTGAIDDGAGQAITLAAAKTIIDHNLKPKRTIRVVFWGSEEVSQPAGSPTAETGGGAFREAHKAELGTYIAAGESDFGADKVYSYSLMPTDDKDFVTKLDNLLYPLGIFNDAKLVPDGGEDSGALSKSGVAAFDLHQDGYRYFDTHHTADDVLERIDPQQMSQNVAAWAATIWMLANTDVKFKAPPKANP